MSIVVGVHASRYMLNFQIFTLEILQFDIFLQSTQTNRTSRHFSLLVQIDLQ